MVYINDLEGKITKINLTSAKTDGLGGTLNCMTRQHYII